ncbi:MAG: enoyl-CoA hydratase/isomerase family protein, partial [Acidimicrobiia bacterium]|nr:enoyl-CoA hydratase/isomerase family protein [Acidimicrobiia bacterium]
RCVVDRPDGRNAMTPAMYFGVRYASNHVDTDPDLAGLLITGTGDVFIPGGDMGGASPDGWGLPPALGMNVTPFDALRQAQKPVVSAVNGICQGGGLMIAMLSDMAVASERATFRVPELLRGIADTHYGHVLARQVGPARTRDLMFTGRVLDAREAVEWGLVSRVVAHEELIGVATEVLVACCRTAPGARSDIKRELDAYYGLYDRIGMQASLGGEEAMEGWRAFKERRPPSWIHPDLRPEGRL